MKKIVLGTIALAAMLAGPAFAADMPLKAPILKAPPPPVITWSGFYIGATVGGAFNESRYNLDPTGCFIAAAPCGAAGLAGNPFRSDARRIGGAGVIAGGEIGYNWQISPNFVAGLETDISWNDLKQTVAVTQTLPVPPFAVPAAFVHSINQKQDWLGTLRARLGFLFTPNALIYATGGLAYGEVKSNTSVSFPPPGGGDTYLGAASSTRVGWTVGGGLEYAVGGGWSAKFEYLFVDLGKFSYTSVCGLAICALVPPPTYSTTIDTREHIGRFGLNYKFGAPVVARY
jgi:outer membrane immunogenic protein